VKELINTNSFGKNEVEFNNNYSCFRKRDDFDFRDKGIKEYKNIITGGCMQSESVALTLPVINYRGFLPNAQANASR
jgi:hypothetical protein